MLTESHIIKYVFLLLCLSICIRGSSSRAEGLQNLKKRTPSPSDFVRPLFAGPISDASRVDRRNTLPVRGETSKAPIRPAGADPLAWWLDQPVGDPFTMPTTKAAKPPTKKAARPKKDREAEPAIERPVDTEPLAWWLDQAADDPFKMPTTKPVPPKKARKAEPGTDPEIKKSIADVVARIRPPKSIGEVAAVIALPEGKRPKDVAKQYFQKNEPITELPQRWRPWMPIGMSESFYHQPLYFEDANLERCGYSHGCLQPLLSAGHFFGTIPLLPYKMALQPYHQCVESLGDCPQGCHYSWWENFMPPLDLGASLVQGAAVTGLIFVIP